MNFICKWNVLFVFKLIRIVPKRGSSSLAPTLQSPRKLPAPPPRPPPPPRSCFPVNFDFASIPVNRKQTCPFIVVVDIHVFDQVWISEVNNLLKQKQIEAHALKHCQKRTLKPNRWTYWIFCCSTKSKEQAPFQLQSKAHTVSLLQISTIAISQNGGFDSGDKQASGCVRDGRFRHHPFAANCRRRRPELRQILGFGKHRRERLPS